jgi:hypothetical protein
MVMHLDTAAGWAHYAAGMRAWAWIKPPMTSAPVKII